MASIHAGKRQQQRGINQLMIELVKLYGNETYQSNGVICTHINTQEYSRLVSDLKSTLNKIEKLKKLHIITTPDDTLITNYIKH